MRDNPITSAAHGHLMTPIEFQGIGSLLPHRYPFLLIDRIETYTLNRSITGIKNVNAQDVLLKSIGPDVYPAALIIESIGQLGIALFNLSRGDDKPADIVLGAINDVQIRAIVRPNVTLRLEAQIERMLNNGLVLTGRAFHNNVEVVSVGTLIAMVDPR